MKLLSIETTPNPNSMKLNLDERLPKGVAITYTHENRGDCPAYIEKILAIPGVSSVFCVEDFWLSSESQLPDGRISCLRPAPYSNTPV